MDNHNNIQQKKEKLLFCGMALAALGLVATSPDTASAKTTAPAQTTEQPNTDKDNADTNKDTPIVRDWNGLKVTYDQKTHELTIPEGTITASEKPSDSDADFADQVPTPINAIEGIDHKEIQRINFKGKLTIKGSASGLFSNLPKLEKIDLTNVDTSNVTNMDNLFAFCSGLKEIDGLTNTENVNSMGAMFYNCSSLTNIDLSHFSTNNVTCMISMFRGCLSLTKLDLSNFDARSLYMMGHMFEGDKNLTSLNIGTLRIANYTSVKPEITTKDMLKGLDSLSNFTFNTSDDFSKTGFDTKAIWQEVGTGTPEKPAGKDKLSTPQLLAQYPVKNPAFNTVTYVKVAEDHSSVTPSSPSTPTVTAPVTNNNTVTKPTTPSTPKPIERPVYRTVMHNTYVYNQNGALKSGEYFAGQSIATYGTKIIDGKKYYALGDNSFVKANNISGIKRRLTHNAYLYNAKGKRANRKVLKKHKSVVTYGGSVKIHGKRFYIVGKNRYVKKANF